MEDSLEAKLNHGGHKRNTGYGAVGLLRVTLEKIPLSTETDYGETRRANLAGNSL